MPETRSQSFRVEEQDLRRELAFETTNNPSDGDSASVLPVVTLASLDMDDELRVMIETGPSPDVLPRLYKDLRERLDQIAATVPDTLPLEDHIRSLTRLVTEAREPALEPKADQRDLREMVQDHIKETDHATAATQWELHVTRGRVESIADTLLEPESVNNKILVLTSRLQDIEQQTLRANDKLRELHELASSLNTENTILRNRLRNLDEPRPVATASQHFTPSHTSREEVARLQDTSQVPVASQSTIVESASRAVPSREGPALLPPPPERMRASSRLEPPTYEEFLSGVRATARTPRPRVETAPAPATTPLTTVADPQALVTTCDTLTPSVSQTQAVIQVQDREGPFYPGLLPYVPMLTAFKRVVSYRSYTLRDTRATLSAREGDVLYRVKRRFDSLYSTFTPFDGTRPIKLLEFLSTLREGFDTLQVSEAVAALALAFYLEGSAKTHFTAQTSPGVQNSNAVMARTWPYLVDSMLKRYLTDDVLQQAYDQVTNARQKADEDENTFTDRLVSAARDCCNVFHDRDLVNYYFRGLLPSTRDAVTERVRQLPAHQQGDITVARRVAQAEGNTYRARRAAPSTSSVRTKSPSRPKVMMVTDQTEDLTPTLSPPRRDPNLPHLFGGPEVYWAQIRKQNPEQDWRIARNLESFLFVGNSKDSSRMPPTSHTSSASLEDLVTRNRVDVPELTETQYRDSITVIPPDYWNLNCWTYKTEGHTTFTCPSLSPAQRMYFAYCSFLYQCKGHPAMRDWLHDRYAKRLAREQDRQDPRRESEVRDSPRLKSPRGDKPQGKPYQNRVGRNMNKGVRFGKWNGVFITTHIGDTPPAATWHDKSDNSSESENEKGQE